MDPPRSKKRPFDDVDQEDSVAATFCRLSSENGDGPTDPWHVVQRRMKKRKTNKKRSKSRAESPVADGSNKPSLTVSPLHRIHSSLKVSDLQHLLLYCLVDGTGPQWISVGYHGQVRRAIVLMVPGLERAMFTGGIRLGGELDSTSSEDLTENGAAHADDATSTKAPARSDDAAAPLKRNPDDFLPIALEADSLPEALKPLADIFPHVWPVKAPGDDKFSKLHSPLHKMLTSAVPRDKKVQKGEQAPAWVDERTPITHFIASRDELQENDYVPHPVLFSEGERPTYEATRAVAKTLASDGWRDVPIDDPRACDVPDLEIEQGSVTAGRTVLAVDCEMCIVEGGEYALTRISIVNWDGDVVLDDFVKPEKAITDYLTAYSGVSEKSLEGISTTLAGIQEKLLKLFHPRTILLGHSLESDLRAMKMTHPSIVDTTILYPHPRGPPLKSSLKYLANKYLSREIQKGHGTAGHDSIEDARACLDLVKLKCEKGPTWGSGESSGEPIFKRLLRSPKPGSTVSAGGAQREGRNGAMVDFGATEKSFGSTASYSIGCASDAEVVAGVRRAVLGDETGAEIPSGGVDFTFARFRELEFLRGWSKVYRSSTQRNGATRSDLTESQLATAVARVVGHIAAVKALLPPCSLFIVFSGAGDPRELLKLQEQYRTFKGEYAYKKWDELSVKWTDVEEQAMKKACIKARDGIGFVCMT